MSSTEQMRKLINLYEAMDPKLQQAMEQNLNELLKVVSNWQQQLSQKVNLPQVVANRLYISIGQLQQAAQANPDKNLEINQLIDKMKEYQQWGLNYENPKPNSPIPTANDWFNLKRIVQQFIQSVQSLK